MARVAGWPTTCCSCQAADVHEPERPCGRRPAAVLQGRAGRPAGRVRRRAICRSGGCGCGARGIGGRAQRAEVDHRVSRVGRELPACAWAWGAATRGAIWPSHVLARGSGRRGRRLSEAAVAGGRRRGGVRRRRASSEAMNRFNGSRESRSVRSDAERARAQAPTPRLASPCHRTTVAVSPEGGP